ELFQISPLQRVLVLRIALPAADANILSRLQEERRSRHLRQLAAQARDDPLGRQLALGERLQRDEDEAGGGLAAADEAHDILDRWVLAQDGDELRQLLPHRLERDALVRLDAA